jgi:hypothetical protein
MTRAADREACLSRSLKALCCDFCLQFARDFSRGVNSQPFVRKSNV